MKKVLNIVLLLILFSQCREKATPQTATDEDTSKPILNNPKPAQDTVLRSEKTFPFELSASDGRFAIQAFVDGKPLYPKYYQFFKKYGYEGNGPCWEGHIRQILDKIDPTLLSHLEFDAEAGTFLAYADSRQTQQRFVDILSPIFSNLDSLAVWVKQADRSKIDD
jgi:hypothetical protein